MKNLIVVFTFLFSLSCSAQKSASNKTGGIKPLRVTVTGKLMQTQSYCGGMAPTPEMEAQYQKAFPYSGKVFYVRKGKVNSTKAEVLTSFTVDAKGEFSFQITPGTYSIIQAKQLKPLTRADLKSTESLQVDAKCMKEWWAKPYYLLEVKTTNITIPDWSIHHPCFVSGDIPCISYTGPMPP
ncbi:MAG: hypothetical protein KBG47_08845 [Bacteroidia bacterium]|jgi:hypothetical protein|nr:hypothetical protein [Sphingobacteriaceae bacterium]MBP9069602.1 hypothetical protein [Bacteroidia bacterium]